MNQQRANPRLRSLLRGQVIFPNKNSTLDCIVRDISGGGARLHIGQHNTLPDHFYLHVPLKEATYSVRVRWREGEDVGVMFNDEHEAAVSPDLSARVEALEDELRHLKTLVGTLQDRLAVWS